MRINIHIYSHCLFPAVFLFFQVAYCQYINSAETKRIPGQIIIDPNNGSYLVYDREKDGNGSKDPLFLIGSGDPEGFLYLGDRNPDGTRSNGSQLHIIQKMKEFGGNSIYLQSIRSFGGDASSKAGDETQSPFNDPSDPASGLNPNILNQWKYWFDKMKEANIIIFFFLYDDGAHPFDNGLGAVGSAEQNYIREIVKNFQDYPNLIWIVQEEFKYVGFKEPYRNPDDAGRVKRVTEIAQLIKKYDDYDHPVGVHHNLREGMEFANVKAVDIYVQQPGATALRNEDDLDTLHAAGAPGKGFDLQHRYNYIMGEAYYWHRVLLNEGNRRMLRQSYYATAMTGGYIMVLGMFAPGVKEPTNEMLSDMRRLQRFFEATDFNTMVPSDGMKAGDTRWVLANTKDEHYILYSNLDPKALGVKSLPDGKYILTWFNPINGKLIKEIQTITKIHTLFSTPSVFGDEVIVYAKRMD